MERPPRPRQEAQPRRSVDDDDRSDPADVNKDEDEAWHRWVNDESGKVEVPLPPLPDQPEMGIHAPTPEMDEEDLERQRDFERRRKNSDDPENAERGVWEMKNKE